MANKRTIEKRDKAAREALKGLRSEDKNERYEAYKKAVKIINGIQRNIENATMPCQEVQVPFVMVALIQCFNGLLESYKQYASWVSYIQSLFDIAETERKTEVSDDKTS